MKAAVRSLQDFKEVREFGFRVHMLAAAIYGMITFGGPLKGYRQLLGNWQRVDRWICGAWNGVYCLIEDVVWDIGSDGIHWYENVRELEGAMKRIAEQARKDRDSPSGPGLSSSECARRILAAEAELERFEEFVRPYYRDPWQWKRRFHYMNRILRNAAKYAERYGQEVSP